MRKRKVTAEGLLLCFLKSIFNGNSSFRKMASRLGRIDEISITKQGLWKRVDHTAIAFLLATLTTALGQRWQVVSKKQPGLAKLYGPILTEDSTQHCFHMSNAKIFKAHGNGKSETAGVKVDLTIDLLTGQAVDETIHCATAQDKNLGKDIVDLVKARDLYTCRWNIEIIFRAWKQGMNLSSALDRKSNEHHLQALVLVAMIYQVLALGVFELLRAKFERNKGQVSLEKTFSNFGEVITESRTLAQLEHYNPGWLDVRMDYHNDRQPLILTWLTLLS